MNKLKKWRGKYPYFNTLASTFLVLMIMLVVLAISSDKFLTARNITNILNQAAIYIVLGVGMTIVMTSGGIDISIGSLIGLTTSIVGTFVIALGFPWWMGIIIALVVGSLAGAFNGLFVVKLKVPSIIVTLGSMTMFRGLAYTVIDGKIYYGYDKAFLWLGRGKILGVPVPVCIAAIVFIVGWYFLDKTKTGRHIKAIGGNVEAARLAGIPVGKLRMLVFVIMGFLGGLATILATAKLGSSEGSAGGNVEMHTIAAVVVGGTALGGGVGLILGTLFGVIILAVLENGLLIAGVSYFMQRVLLGLIFILVVASRSFRQKDKNVS